MCRSRCRWICCSFDHQSSTTPLIRWERRKMKYLLIVLLFAGCGGGASNNSGSGMTPATPPTSAINRGAIFPSITGMEATPIVWNGELLYVGTMLNPASVVVVRQRDTVVMATLPPMQFVSALVTQGTLYVFGANSARTEIRVTSSTDLVTWTPETVIYTAPPGRNVFNSSVTVSPNGYTMAYEICDVGQICFNSRFLQSPDLINWTETGHQYQVGIYTACPTIRYSAGYYYLFYLTNTGQDYSTRVSRSIDLVNWEQSPVTVLSGALEPSGNASDFDMVELGGQMRFVYSNLSQTGQVIQNTGLREATFNGTMTQFLGLFF